MFKKEGFLTPYEVCMAIIDANKRLEPDESGGPRRCRRKYALNEFWSFVGSLQHVYLMGKDGTMVMADSHLAQSTLRDKEYGPFLRVSTGILQAEFVYWKDLIKPKWWQFWRWPPFLFSVGRAERFDYIRDRFLGDFAGMAVVFPEAWVTDYFKEAEGENEACEHSARSSEASVSQMIIAAFDAGEPMTRISARERFGPEMGTRSFARA